MLLERLVIPGYVSQLTEFDAMQIHNKRNRVVQNVLGTDVDVLSWSDAVERIFSWAATRESRAVCICNVHNIITARQILAHGERLRSADMVTPDGAPIAWFMRKMGHLSQERIAGPDLMMKCCERAAETGEGIFLYGGTDKTLKHLKSALLHKFPELKIIGAVSPPFRELTRDEDAAIVELINSSGASIVWVGLGCPKQEAWMHAHKGQIKAVMVGVGAAFDFHAGLTKRAPVWMQKNGWEWLYRLLQDPRRLAKRYLTTNTIFLAAVMGELLRRPRTVVPTGHLNKPADLAD
ncbi:WecB/TagA/CpsF family glycosyltransferase [Microvirga arabica]|uniref:WecB/TagA/CpsF family glycosyltransferase n=1 Tax=Microvirga arabica TaxID=1128671 RepID=A0ABV6YDJ9_9HYPH